MDFWTRLKKEVKAKNTTQEWVAKKAGVPFGTLRKWLSNKTYPNARVAQSIAGLLETSVEYLMTGVEPSDLDKTERKMVELFRKLSPADRENALLALGAWAGKSRPSLLETRVDPPEGPGPENQTARKRDAPPRSPP